MDKQEFWDKSYNAAKKKGHSAKDAQKIADKNMKNYKEPEKVEGKKSFVVSQSSDITSDNYLDVLMGYPGMDVEAEHGGHFLDPSGWSNLPNQTLIGDIEHYNFDLSHGIHNDLDEKWQHFRAEAEDFYQASDGLRARVKIPDTETGREFKELYKAGKYGASIEYSGYEDNNMVKDWTITGFTFTKDPSYNKTKASNSETDN